MKVYIVTCENEILRICANESDAQIFADNYEQGVNEYCASPVYVNIDEWEIY